jgi:hypothetical protein
MSLFGSLALAGRSWDAGEAKVNDTASMRVAHEFLRAQLEGQHAQRMKKMPEWPIIFAGERDEIRFAAPLPARVQSGGIWYYRLHIADVDGKQSLVLDRMIPDVTQNAPPQFDGAEHRCSRPASRRCRSATSVPIRRRRGSRLPGPRGAGAGGNGGCG